MAKLIAPPYFGTVVNAGEKRLLDFLQRELPDSYYLIPNVELASTHPRNQRTQYWEYDLIVVAPHALYNIENKDWKGRIEGDDNYWYVNDRQRPNPLKTNRQKTAILASKLKEQNRSWGRAWVHNLITLSFPNIVPPNISHEAQKVTFRLNNQLVEHLTNPYVRERKSDITDIQEGIVAFFKGEYSKKRPDEKREVEGYEITEVLQQEPNFTEYLVKPKGVHTAVKRRVKEYALEVSGLSAEELQERQSQIQNQYNALSRIKAKPFILNVEFRVDEENHLFYEISDYLDENSLQAEFRSKTFTFQQKLSIVRNLMAALREAHKENIFHRDINPENVFMIGGYAYLGNFGKSYFADDHREGYTVMATLTEQSATAYHPLEVVAKDASRASDIYSLGVLIYWLFTGQLPLKTPYELNNSLGRLAEDKLPSKINAALPKWLDALTNQCIVVDETQRFDSIDEMEAFIDSAIKENETHTIQAQVKKKVEEQSPLADELHEGDRLGAFILHHQLGKGGYSRVFKVKHQLQDKFFTLKLFHESVSLNAVTDEYSALRELDHPNIVKFIWNDLTPQGQFYTVMEFIDGENLGVYSRTDARLPIYRVYELAEQILSALVSMQDREQAILHRDIKPQNIMWDKSERFVLIDFNVASFAEANKDFVGTNPYLAPDLVQENYKVHWNTSADTFALGITLFELLCKQYPWPQSKMPIMSKSPLLPKELEPRISEQFSDFVFKAIQTEGAKRFANAQEMLLALQAIGKEGILQKEVSENLPAVESGTEVDIVKYINSLYSQSQHGNAGTRANFDNNQLDDETYTPTKLDKELIPAIMDGQFKLLIITGNAGDGKTAFIRKIESHKQVKELKRFGHKNGASFSINQVPYETNYDGSQDEEERANNEVLESFFAPFENLSDYSKAEEGRIIAINEGRLVEFLKTTDKHNKLHDTIEDYFYKEGHHELPDGLMIINLNLRSVSAKSEQESSLFRQQVKALTQKKLWGKCNSCPVANTCFIKYNVDTLNDTATGDEIITRLEWLLRTANLKRELHITMRDLRSFIAFLLTRDHTCEEVSELQKRLEPERYWQLFYFNITNPTLQDSGNHDRLIKLLRETDIGEVSIPNQDRDLFFAKHKKHQFLEFAERSKGLLDEFNANKVYLPPHEQGESISLQIKSMHKVFARHQYFEGKSDLVAVQNGEQTAHVPSYLMRLPYHSVFRFISILEKGDEDGLTKLSLSRAISLNEGCDNPAIDNKYLVLASSEAKDPLSKSFRLFDLNDFELFVNQTEHLVNYLEYEPDSLTIRHKEEKHIRLTVSLDLFEMLYFIQQGFSPSLNDLRGKFVELVIFKNLLKNLHYNKVIVTKDNVEFYEIGKDAQNRLYLQAMEV